MATVTATSSETQNVPSHTIYTHQTPMAGNKGEYLDNEINQDQSATLLNDALPRDPYITGQDDMAWISGSDPVEKDWLTRV